MGADLADRGPDLLAAVNALRQRPGGDVNIMGSAQLVRSLPEADLVDELNPRRLVSIERSRVR